MVTENKKSVPIEIPSTLAEKLKREATRKGYKDLSEYVTYLLRGKSSSDKEEISLKPEEEKQIEERLKNLGYID